jgi:two-component system, NarL family, sensor histidine kinase UhpB
MLPLHQETLYAVLAVSGTASAAVFAGLARYAPRIAGPGFWAAAYACLALTFASTALTIDDWRIASLLFNIPFAIGPVFMFAGLTRFYGGERRDRLVQMLIVAGVAATVVFTFLWPNTATRIATLSLVMAAGYGGGARVAWRETAGPGQTVARLLALTFLVNAISTLARATIIVLAPVQYSFNTPDLGGLNSVTWVMYVLVVALSAPMLVLAVAVKLLASLETEKRRTETSEAQFRELATSADVGIFVTDTRGHCTYTNPRWKEITGLPGDAGLGDGWKAAFLSEDIPDVIAAWRDAVRGIRSAVRTVRVRRPGGELRWVRSHPVALRSPGEDRSRYLTTVEDITDLRNSYERIRELAQRLETVREDERRSVAHALHEGVAQDLVAATLDLNRLRSQSGGDSRIVAACDDVARSIDKCIGDLRQLTNSLRPGTLAHLPLATAIAQYARQFGERAGLRVEIVENSTIPSLSDATRLAFFRAVQETLTNVARHARATEVTIALGTESGQLKMTIGDDGVGVGEKDLEKVNALGLLGIQERFTALGGGLEVLRREPRGTTVTVHLPAPEI